MRTGLFCTYESTSNDYRSAYSDQTHLIELAERLGFDEAWIAEHHFNPRSACSNPFAILGYLAARTSRICLGSAAILLPFHNPIMVAEGAATVDILSGGRFNLGVAKGGPFPMQLKHFGLSSDEASARTREAVVLVEKLLTEKRVDFDGTFHQADSVELTPQPLQQPLPIFVATSTPDMIALAATRGYGLMAGPPFPIAHLRNTLRLYRETAPNKDPRLVLTRFLHIAPTREQAVAEARMMLQPFVERMRKTTEVLQPSWTPWMDLEPIIEGSLIGTQMDVRAKLSALQADLNPHSLIVKPITAQHDKQCEDLVAFAELSKTSLAA
ncbi:LLM class flavin-dependent oxidoreductase [Hyphomicrobium sp. D-2]|uniref:LLM class flavin-dependent oxidoreductase n=1 Tax=Hyphomicrobium sp. D-2 TaxID=3041621 RepID=UPI002458CB72|nr:LLM class flavin-dependent oxidoreductase [Hyphomicrobium sp. D-2]MDH4982417.1 LLM class flavin-dependent oxidoreductase [Hyphomicrobium sp. D-2]